MNCSHQKEARL